MHGATVYLIEAHKQLPFPITYFIETSNQTYNIHTGLFNISLDTKSSGCLIFHPSYKEAKINW